MKKNTIDVLVIGTEPPCPRCDLMSCLAEELAGEASVEVNVRHCAFDSSEAFALGQKFGRKVGTAKHVADAAGISMDWNAVYALIQSKSDAVGPDRRPAETWTLELDEMLEPCQFVADTVGYFMTPVLVVNGSVKHHGSVPSREKIQVLIFGE
ncbi:hypothetical protein [Desulfomonile tiedjei]|nr:hypothetical protein [Desulfomonile tiedjei]